MKTLVDLIGSFAKRDKVALRYHNGFRRSFWTYKELHRDILRFAHLLQQKGVRAGDRVLIWGPNSPWWVIALLGTIAHGAVAVPADLLATAETVDLIAKDCKPRLIVKTRHKPKLRSKLKIIGLEQLPYLLDRQGRSREAAPGQLAELVYTSGTTGSPKGVMLSHANILSNVEAINRVLPLYPEDATLSLLPLSHLFEQTCGLLVPLSKGASISYISTLKPSAIFGELRRGGTTILVTVPRILQAFKQSIERKAKENLAPRLALRYPGVPGNPIRRLFGPKFRFFVSGGAALDGETERFWRKLGFSIHQGYGLTECSPVVTVETEEIPQCVGRPIPGVEVKLADNGEVLVRGPNVFQGYYKDQKKTHETVKMGWLHTGDIGELKNGCLFLKGRQKDVIVTGAGINVYPHDIEQTLSRMEGIRESCVLGLPSKHGEEVHAVIIPEKDVDLDRVVLETNRRLSSAQRIMGYSIWPERSFPKTPTLKVKKHLVLARIGEKMENSTTQDSFLAPLLLHVARTKHIGPEARLYRDLKIDSLGRVELVSLIEQEFRMDFEEELIDETTTVHDLERMVEERRVGSRRIRYPQWPQSLLGRMLRRILMECVTNMLDRIWVTLDVKGRERIEALQGPIIFAANHVSYIDQPTVLRAMPPHFRYAVSSPAWNEFFQGRGLMRLWKRFCYLYVITVQGVFMLSHKHSWRRSLEFAGNLVDQGESIFIHPEGERTVDGKLLPFMQGTALLAEQLDLPVVPIGIKGMRAVFPYGAKWLKRGKVTVEFGKPIRYKGEGTEAFTKRLRKEIAKLTDGS